ncbi:hypothetical protein WICPIJ_001062 [Wickerhamomyces pijperi]|uniref:NADP-dependent oxidoreductase domain-containing protein n=1 Tax=Wickerhamomyces pijperi TaxID=599730 RepID=A0A9P8QBF4_WICPI|nr:hypothetical protein WICPIJ_001062 [Wickerhamomyces pijperi]
MPLQYFKLQNGNKIPAISIFGTGTQWFKTDESQFNSELTNQISKVLEIPGVVHLDAAEIYRTYPELGAALKNSTKPRDEIWITDKFSRIHDDPIQALDYSLSKLGVEYVDLYLLHSPFTPKPNADGSHTYDLVKTWKQLEELVRAGKTRNIGVSNFGVEDLEKILEIAEIRPQVNQIEYNAFLQNQTPGIYDFAQKHQILLEAYSPLSPLSVEDKSGEFFQYVQSLASKYSTDSGIILLRWVYQRGVLPVTTSSKFERVQQSNDKIWEIELTEEEVNKISKLGEEHETVRKYWKPFYDQYN